MYTVQWIIAQNPTSPDYFSRVHLSLDANGVTTICKCGGGFVGREVNIFKGDMAKLLSRELALRKDTSTDQKGVYCITCLKQALRMEEV